MLYYKVKPEFDNTKKVNRRAHLTRYHYKDDIWIGGEIYTQGELDRLKKQNVVVCDAMFEPVEIPKNKTYFFFGARFGEV